MARGTQFLGVKTKGMKKALRTLSPKHAKKATKRTLHKASKQLINQTNRTIIKVYNIKSKRLKAGVSTFPKSLSATTDSKFITYEGKRPGLMNFSAKMSKRKIVKVKVLKQGGRKVVPGAFIAKGQTGTAQVFRRKGTTRLPLDRLTGPSIPGMFNKRGKKFFNKNAPIILRKVFFQEYNFILIKGR